MGYKKPIPVEINKIVIGKKYGSITNFVGFPIPLVALSAHIE